LLGYQTACDLEVIQIIHNVDASDNIAERYPGIDKGI